MSGFFFQRATVARARARIALVGPAGSGKTYGALLIASGLVGDTGRIAVIDTERGRSVNYADVGIQFDVGELTNHEPEGYMEAVGAAYQLVGRDGVVIVDSLSHEWTAVLEMVDRAAAASRSGSKFTAWNGPSQEHRRLMEFLIQSPCHVIVTMRAEMEYQVEGGSVKKLGLGPTQRKGVEYEWDVAFDVTQEHLCSVSKCNAISLGKILGPIISRDRKITPAIGQAIRGWIEGAPAPIPLREQIELDIARADPALQDAMREAVAKAGRDEARLRAIAERIRAKVHRLKAEVAAAPKDGPTPQGGPAASVPPPHASPTVPPVAISDDEALGLLGADDKLTGRLLDGAPTDVLDRADVEALIALAKKAVPSGLDLTAGAPFPGQATRAEALAFARRAALLVPVPT